MKSMNNTTGDHRELPEDMLTKEQVSFIQFPFTLSAYEVKIIAASLKDVSKERRIEWNVFFRFRDIHVFV